MSLEEAIKICQEAGYQVVRWRCTGLKDAHYGRDEGKGSDKRFGLYWIDNRRWTIDGLKAPAPCTKGGGLDCKICQGRE